MKMAESPQELAKSLNEIVRLLEKKDKNSTLRVEEMRRSLQNSSNAIDLMLSDEKLFEQLVASHPDCEVLVQQVLTFEAQFIPIENTALKKAGVSPKAKNNLIRQSRNRRKTISLSGDYRKELKNHLKETQKTLNSFLKQLNDTDNALNAKKAIQKNWRRISYLVGGVALVAIDTSLGTANPAIAAVSAIFGTDMITRNY